MDYQAGQDRLQEEQEKAQLAVTQKIDPSELEYMREHPAFKQYMYTKQYFDFVRNHPVFENTEALQGKIIYQVA